jgi:hypothetical protein
MTSAVPTAAKTQAQGLALPSSPEIVEGKPKIPLPMMQLTMSAARLQRPMARRSVGCELGG